MLYGKQGKLWAEAFLGNRTVCVCGGGALVNVWEENEGGVRW